LRAGALDRSGALAAFAIGAIVFAALGWAGAAVLFAFFVPATLLSRLGKRRKRALVDVGKTGPRDALQVLANGGIAAVCAAGAVVFGKPWNAAFAGAFAAAAADTWGTEIGTLAKQRARSILNGQPIPTGMSGGVTAAGTLAEIAGAAVVALVTFGTGVAAIVPVAVAGITGATLDSILGATVQELRYCPHCERSCETDPHVCGTPTYLRRGRHAISNDAVNLAATCCGALVAALLSP
jgi:uncharacterized protein (TIGR00297 family)